MYAPTVAFLIDPPLLVAAGAAIEAGTEDARTAGRLEKLVLGVFLTTSVSLYLNLGWTRWMWRLCRTESGRDLMLNSWVFHMEHARPRAKVHAISAGIFATYPLWIRLGRRIGAALRTAS